MNFTTLLVFLGVIGTVCSGPVCPHNCTRTGNHHHHQLYFKHVSDLGSSSVAPWDLLPDTDEDREPSSISNAVCKDCSVANMIAKRILLKINVYRKVNNGTNNLWCKCPYELAVGCTCVREQKH